MDFVGNKIFFSFLYELAGIQQKFNQIVLQAVFHPRLAVRARLWFPDEILNVT